MENGNQPQAIGQVPVQAQAANTTVVANNDDYCMCRGEYGHPECANGKCFEQRQSIHEREFIGTP